MIDDDALAELRQILRGLSRERLASIASEPKERWPYLTLDMTGKFRLVDGAFTVDDGMQILVLCQRLGDNTITQALQSEAKRLLESQARERSR